MPAERSFPAMGTQVHTIVFGGDRALSDLAAARIKELENRWTRFRPDSEISRLNQHAGEPVIVSPATFLLIQRCLQAFTLTAGAFDPTMHDEIAAAGYDRSFDHLDQRSAKPVAAGTGPRFRRSPAGRIRLDASLRSVVLPAGCAVDAGGLGKGLAADLVAQELISHGATGVCINIGGDLRLMGRPGDELDWYVDVASPYGGPPIATLALDTGAVATTSPLRRRWGNETDPQHHLLDPATGQPAQRGLSSVTVVSLEGWRAEALAKAAFLAGRRALIAIRRAGATGLIVDEYGQAHFARDLQEAAS